MKIHLSEIVIINRAPFSSLRISLNEADIAVLTAINGRGKTTILSHIVDAFYEMTKHHFSDVAERAEEYYRISSDLDSLEVTQPSLVYLRFIAEDQKIDYIDLRGPCTKEEYESLIDLDKPIIFDKNFAESLELSRNIKYVTENLSKELARNIFPKNVTTYFPAYRFEIPSYLNKPFQERLAFSTNTRFTGRLDKPFEVYTSLPTIANWLMDVVLDIRQVNGTSQNLFDSLNTIITNALSSKNLGAVRFGVGPRQMGSTRIQIMQATPEPQTIYPSIFRLSSGESALLCIFAEILRHGDLTATSGNLAELSGIVLIDEIDKHLHIKLQKEVLPKLFDLFPKIQFIVSSHSPFLNMGLAELLPERSRVIDIQSGLTITPSTDPQYQEVYEMMINENTRFKSMYESVLTQIDAGKQLQILSEGKNYEHIQKALSILAPDILSKIKLINGAEDKSGEQQLKNAFEIMSKANHSGNFLVVWDCDSSSIAEKVLETDSFYKFCFEKNSDNTCAEKGIENLYSTDLFTSDLYDEKSTNIGYGGTKTEITFNKNRFGEKIKGLTNAEYFLKFQPLIEKIRSLVTSLPAAAEDTSAE